MRTKNADSAAGKVNPHPQFCSKRIDQKHGQDNGESSNVS